MAAPDATEPAPGRDAPPSHTTVLLRGVRRGDKDALDRLLEEELPWIRRLVHQRLAGIVRSLNDTGDIVGEIAVALLTKGPGLEIESRDHFQNLLARMVGNTLRSQAKALRARPPAGVDQVTLNLDQGRATSFLSPPEAASRAEETAWCWLAVELLGGAEQDILRLRLVDDLSFVEIGEALGAAADTVRRRYDRAVPKLQALIRQLKAGHIAHVLA